MSSPTANNPIIPSLRIPPMPIFLDTASRLPCTRAPRRRPATGLCAIALGIALMTSACGKSETAAKPAAAIPVSVSTVKAEDVAQWADGIGNVTPLRDVTLRAQVSGLLSEVLFREGQAVERGTLLARIDDREYAAALAQAQAEKARNQAQLKAAELDLQRYQNLVGEEAVPRQTVEQQQATVEQMRATIRANEAAIAAAQVQVSYTRITAPIAGRVGLRLVDPGNLVQPSDTRGLVTVTQIHPISVVFTLPQQQLPLIRHLLAPEKGREAAVVEAFDRDGGADLGAGKLTMIDNTVDTATGMVRLRAEFDNQDARLWPGQFVTVRLRTGTRANVLTVPVRALRHGLNGAYVFRVNGSGDEAKAEMVSVKPGYQNDTLAVITEGLAAGDRVVIDGYSRIKGGSRVREVQAALAGVESEAPAAPKAD